ncbi:hypothetical protein LTR08_008586 [Meristemomyces frigidus]|nr:hypothetical protein LTR08_008586 [Meristemomyces frigidus]
MYRRLLDARAWPGPVLTETTGHPLTHDILKALKLLDAKDDGTGVAERIEEDCERLQSKLLSGGAGYAQRRTSFSSESEHSQHDAPQPTPASALAVQPSKPPTFRENFNFGSASPSPLVQSPGQHQRRSFPAAQPSPLQQSSPYIHDPPFYAAEWSIPDMSSNEQSMRSRLAMQPPTVQPETMSHMENVFASNQFDAPLAWNLSNFGGNTILGGLPQQPASAYPSEMEYVGFDPAEIEFHKYVQCNA